MSVAPSALTRHPWSSAAKRRNLLSLGREPQDSGHPKEPSREAATDNGARTTAAHAAASIFRPFRAFAQRSCRTLGLTPRAINLPRLRRSIIQGVEVHQFQRSQSWASMPSLIGGAQTDHRGSLRLEADLDVRTIAEGLFLGSSAPAERGIYRAVDRPAGPGHDLERA